MNHECASCRRGERQEPATVRVRGTNANGRYIRCMYLCDDHLELDLADGAEYDSEPFALDEITRAYTGYRSFDHLCRGNPTLRPGTFAGVEQLREGFRRATGRVAYA